MAALDRTRTVMQLPGGSPVDVASTRRPSPRRRAEPRARSNGSGRAAWRS